MKPFLLVVTGRPGSGKTTLSNKLGEEFYLPVISRDALKEGCVHTFGKKHDQLPDDTNKIVTDLFFETIGNLLNNNVSLIAEAAFQHKVWESRLTLLSQLADIKILVCETDPTIAKQRFIERGLNDTKREHFHGDKAVQDARDGKDLTIAEYDTPKLPYPTIRIDSTKDYKPSMDELKELVFGK
jgi:broad-specificity NMP kinase